jgi:hypothetical protein
VFSGKPEGGSAREKGEADNGEKDLLEGGSEVEVVFHELTSVLNFVCV